MAFAWIAAGLQISSDTGACVATPGAERRGRLVLVDEGRQVAHLWSAGPGVNSLEAFDRACTRTWSLDAPAVVVSPDGRWAAAYPGPGTPVADDHRIRLLRVQDASSWSVDVGSARHAVGVSFTDEGLRAELDDGTVRTLAPPK